MKGTRILVCGGRDFTDVPKLWKALDDLQASLPEPHIRMVIEGASDDVTGPYVGADYWAHQWALARNIPHARVHAKWEAFGRAAGPIRNQNMMGLWQPDLVVAFAGGRGTANMVGLAKKAGVQVREL
jgi:hypothetical protein